MNDDAKVRVHTDGPEVLVLRVGDAMKLEPRVCRVGLEVEGLLLHQCLRLAIEVREAPLKRVSYGKVHSAAPRSGRNAVTVCATSTCKTTRPGASNASC